MIIYIQNPKNNMNEATKNILVFKWIPFILYGQRRIGSSNFRHFLIKFVQFLFIKNNLTDSMKFIEKYISAPEMLPLT